LGQCSGIVVGVDGDVLDAEVLLTALGGDNPGDVELQPRDNTLKRWSRLQDGHRPTWTLVEFDQADSPSTGESCANLIPRSGRRILG
jgi:hypothetical protein